jgi:effector-binding domain-containing protein
MPTYDVREEQVEAQPTLAIRTEVLPHELAPRMAELLPRVRARIEELGLAPAGQPFTRYHGFGDKLRIEVGYPLPSAAEGEGDVVAGELPGGPAAVTYHVGRRDELPQAHAAVISWAFAKQRSHQGGPYELYLTDPVEEPEQSHHRVKVVLPLSGA